MQKKLNKTLIKLAAILNDGEYHDGNSLGEQLGMTRSAVWKAIHKLENYEVKFDSVKGKGYALLEPLILLDAQRIKKKLTEKVDITIFESIDSTNDYLKSLKSAKQRSVVCLAEQQTKGKGRLGREWYSPFGKNIYLSCLYPFQKDVSELAGLSLVTGIAIFRTLQDVGVNKKLYLKWPNDVLYDNQKLSGTLIEIQAETHGASHAVVGIGINVNMLGGDAITQAWTSLQKILDKYVDRNDLCALLINHLIACFRQFNEYGFASFINEWMDAEYLANRAITLQNLHEKIEGKVVGINEQGHLLLKLANGKVRAFSSGDASIVKKR